MVARGGTLGVLAGVGVLDRRARVAGGAMKETETKIGWMEKRRDLEVGQYHCEACGGIFYFLDDVDDGAQPKHCPLCGRRNVRA